MVCRRQAAILESAHLDIIFSGRLHRLMMGLIRICLDHIICVIFLPPCVIKLCGPPQVKVYKWCIQVWLDNHGSNYAKLQCYNILSVFPTVNTCCCNKSNHYIQRFRKLRLVCCGIVCCGLVSCGLCMLWPVYVVA